jgi:hypothetical protein
MFSVPLRAEFGPSLGELLAPRWRRAGVAGRATALALGTVVVAVAVVVVVATGPSRISVSGPVPFSFSYKGLHRVAPEAGGYARVVLGGAGATTASFAVGPLTLPAYEGSVTGEFPLVAAASLHSLAGRFEGFQLLSEGPIRTSAFGSWEELPPSTIYYHVPSYTIAFTAHMRGSLVYGREIWLVPNRSGARRGVAITMLESPGEAGPSVTPLSLGTVGVLSRPMRSFALGA